MTVELEIKPDLEERILEAARALGVSTSEFVREAVLEKTASMLRERKMTTEEFLDSMAYHGPISDEMRAQEITREFIYGDHP